MQEIFQASEDWQNNCPGASVGVLAMGAAAAQTCPELEKAANDLEKVLSGRFAHKSEIKQLPIVQAYGAWYKRFKKSYHVAAQVESVALKGKAIPRVTPLVTCMFLAELSNMLLTAGHDRDKLNGPAAIRLAKGGESFINMGGKENALKSGDMYIADQNRIISNIVYGPDRETAITPATKNVLFTVYAPPGIGPETVLQHLRDMEAYVKLCAGGAVTELLEVFQARTE